MAEQVPSTKRARKGLTLQIDTQLKVARDTSFCIGHDDQGEKGNKRREAESEHSSSTSEILQVAHLSSTSLLAGSHVFPRLEGDEQHVKPCVFFNVGANSQT